MEVWVGEVKTDAAEFKLREIDKLLRETAKLGATKAFVFALEGNQELLRDKCEEACKTSATKIVHLRPHTWDLSASYHI